MPPRSKKSTTEQIAALKKRIAELEAREESGKFDHVIAKHQQSINTLHHELRAASGKQRGVDALILQVLADAMGMKGMEISKKIQVKKK